jgi:hypothetical protein
LQGLQQQERVQLQQVPQWLEPARPEPVRLEPAQLEPAQLELVPEQLALVQSHSR